MFSNILNIITITGVISLSGKGWKCKFHAENIVTLLLQEYCDATATVFICKKILLTLLEK